MTNAPIRMLILLGSLALAGIIATQVYWASQAISNQEKQFSHSVQMALSNVVESVCELNNTDVPVSNPIEQVSSNYFIVRTNTKINLSALEYVLKAELEKRAITEDFEYGVYDCKNDQMVYGNLVSFTNEEVTEAESDFPKLKKEDYYFAVFFPKKAGNPLWGFDIWKFTTLLTVFVIIFFAYSLFVILKQKKLSAIQRDFVNNITHEFKTPLSTLKVASSVLTELKADENERLKKYASIVRSESQRLEKQVKQLLNSAILENKQKVEIYPMESGRLLKNILEVMKSEYPSIDWKLDLSTENITLLANEFLLESIFYNLLDNAVKYGNDRVNVLLNKEEGYGVFVVKDNGPGIPEKDRNKVYRKFYRVSHGDLHDVKGFGLGLFVVKNAVSALKGSIHLSCKNGCTFTVKLPVHE